MLDLLDGGHARTVKWMGRAIVALVLLLAGAIAACVIISQNGAAKLEANNRYWLDYLAQYDFRSETYEQDGEGLNIIGDRNGVRWNVAEAYEEDEDAQGTLRE